MVTIKDNIERQNKETGIRIKDIRDKINKASRWVGWMQRSDNKIKGRFVEEIRIGPIIDKNKE